MGGGGWVSDRGCRQRGIGGGWQARVEQCGRKSSCHREALQTAVDGWLQGEGVPCVVQASLVCVQWITPTIHNWTGRRLSSS